jgi:hypothetical protein
MSSLKKLFNRMRGRTGNYEMNEKDIPVELYGLARTNSELELKPIREMYKRTLATVSKEKRKHPRRRLTIGGKRKRSHTRKCGGTKKRRSHKRK